MSSIDYIPEVVDTLSFASCGTKPHTHVTYVTRVDWKFKKNEPRWRDNPTNPRAPTRTAQKICSHHALTKIRIRVSFVTR